METLEYMQVSADVDLKDQGSSCMMAWDYSGPYAPRSLPEENSFRALEEAYEALQVCDPGILACKDVTAARALLQQMEGLQKFYKVTVA